MPLCMIELTFLLHTDGNKVVGVTVVGMAEFHSCLVYLVCLTELDLQTFQVSA